jgi:hypothetical protein
MTTLRFLACAQAGNAGIVVAATDIARIWLNALLSTLALIMTALLAG